MFFCLQERGFPTHPNLSSAKQVYLAFHIYELITLAKLGVIPIVVNAFPFASADEEERNLCEPVRQATIIKTSTRLYLENVLIQCNTKYCIRQYVL